MDCNPDQPNDAGNELVKVRRFCASLGLTAIMFLVSMCPLRAGQQVLTLATTTSTENSGLLAYLHPHFERRTGIQIKVVAKGTGASLQLAREGNADLVLVHAREKEDEFIAQGYGVNRRDVMYNDFVIVGPREDPAGVKGLQEAARALRRIAEHEQLFVSRGDGSGTHLKEQFLWKQSGLTLVRKTTPVVKKGESREIVMSRPAGDWYLSIGQGMGKTLNFATEKRGYTIADRGTYYAYALDDTPRTDLIVLCEGGKRLTNPYGVIAVNPARFTEVKFEAATIYIDWITSPEAQQMIGDFRIGGKVLFHPSSLPGHVPHGQ